MTTTESGLPRNSTTRVAVASFIGTAIEFFDFYIFATAAALVIGPIFFPKASSSAQALNAFVTFGIAFLARPVGSALFGHFGDRVGRKSTLVASLLVMGVSTTLIGCLPGYASLGILAPILLCVLRIGQGIGVGGEWGGAALLATENAPAGKRGWYGMFPQLGPSIGFLCANGLFFGLALWLSDHQFKSWGWRIPFIFSAVLVMVGLYVRLKLHESPVFTQAMKQKTHQGLPLLETLGKHWVEVIQGSFAMVVCYTLFYISAVFSLSYGVQKLHIAKPHFLGMLCFAVLFMALGTPISAWLSDKWGRRPVLLLATALAAASGFSMQPLLSSGTTLSVGLFLVIELFLMGLTFGPMGAMLPEIFPTHVRYTGSSIAYNVGGIIGASIAPVIAQLLVEHGGLSWVGAYVSVAALISFLAVLSMRETHRISLTDSQEALLASSRS